MVKKHEKLNKEQDDNQGTSLRETIMLLVTLAIVSVGFCQITDWIVGFIITLFTDFHSVVCR